MLTLALTVFSSQALGDRSEERREREGRGKEGKDSAPLSQGGEAGWALFAWGRPRLLAAGLGAGASGGTEEVLRTQRH